MVKKILILLFISFVAGLAAILILRTNATDVIKEQRDVTVKLKWEHQAQFAGNYVAKEKGYYAEEGLNIDLIPLVIDGNTAIQTVSKGEHAFGIASADELVIARSKGLPLKAFAVIYKTNPVVAYSLKGSGIVKPQDFVGKTVGVERSKTGTEFNTEILYKAMLSKLGIDRGQVNEISIGFSADELLRGDTDVSVGYIINEPYQVVEELGDVNTILMADYGVNMYADVLITTEDMIDNDPELVQRFLNATIKGWEYALRNQAEAVDMTMKYAVNSSRSRQEYMLKTSLPLIHTGESRLGTMEASEWGQVHNILLKYSILDRSINVDEIYTNEFIENYYEEKSENR